MSTFITPPMRINWPHLLRPYLPRNPRPGMEPRFQCDLLKERNLTGEVYEGFSEEDFDKMETSVKDFNKIYGTDLPSPFLRDFAAHCDIYDPIVYEYVIRPWSYDDHAPVVVDGYSDPKDPEGRPRLIRDPSEIYSGCYVRAMLDIYSEWKQIHFALKGIQFWADGPRLIEPPT